MKYGIAGLFILCTFLLPSFSHADTMARVFPVANQAMISVYKGMNGNDADGEALFKAMTVHTEDTFLGPGKFIKDTNQIFSLNCADRGQNGFQCTIMIQSSAVSQIAANPIRIRYELTGAEAQALAPLFYTNTPDGHFVYQNAEGTLAIDMSADRAFITYNE